MLATGDAGVKVFVSMVVCDGDAMDRADGDDMLKGWGMHALAGRVVQGQT